LEGQLVHGTTGPLSTTQLTNNQESVPNTPTQNHSDNKHLKNIQQGTLRPISGHYSLTPQHHSSHSNLHPTHPTHHSHLQHQHHHHQHQQQSLLNKEFITKIGTKIVELKDIFRQVDPIEERRVAAMTIQALIRGYLARSRLRYYYQGLREWRWTRCRPVIWVLDILLTNQSKLDTGFHLLHMNRTMKTLHSIYGKWAIIYRQNAPMRRDMRRRAAEKIAAYQLRVVRHHFVALKAVTIVKLSRKHANAERRKLMDQIRYELSREALQKAPGQRGIIPEYEVIRVLHRRVVEQFQDRKRMLHFIFKFQAWKILLTMKRTFHKRSKQFHFQHSVGKCFYAWSDYIYLKSRGLDRKRWPGPRKYEVRYNQKRVNHFYQVRIEKLVFIAWKSYFLIQHEVKIRFQRKLTSFVRNHFYGWRDRARHHHRLRQLVYDNWKGYSKIIMFGPFQGK
jgi:hypothetical protein